MRKTLILGGVKSGKSRLAENWAKATALPVTYIATATAQDNEMQQRISRHQSERPNTWLTMESPIHLANTLQQADAKGKCLLLDCLTLWLTNLLLAEDETQLRNEIDALLACLPNLSAELVIVSNETNMGIVPLGELSRRYCDEIGLLHQQLASLCDDVILTVAGLPHLLKGSLHEQL
jgi:adenosylcobinamide kinase/adenosylcobinamide-phosphate guanylyltransferase